jgi:hypothetical protein
MQVSAEIRWFWQSSPPSGLEDWFCKSNAHGFAAGGAAEIRTDRYLREAGQTELGIKLRGGNNEGIEIKGLISSDVGVLSLDPFRGPVELWCKWTAKSLNLDSKPVLVTEKLRWLRKFDTAGASISEIQLDARERPLNGKPLPERGCNVEWTRVSLPEREESWWTFGFESFGTIRTVEDDLRAVASELLSRRPPQFFGGVIASYPVWLNSLVSNAQNRSVER